MTERIRWEPTDFGGFTGHVGAGNLEVFRLWIPDHETEWLLAADLPGVSIYGDDPGELKADAERWLAKFIGIVGAVFPDALREAVERDRDIRRIIAADHEEASAWRAAAHEHGYASALDWVLALMDAPAPAVPGGAGEKE